MVYENFNTEGKKRSKQRKKVEGEKETLLDQNSCQAQKQISKRLNAMIYPKVKNWVSYDLKPKNIERRFCMSESYPET